MGWMGGWVHKFGTFSQIKLFFIRLSKRQRKWKIKEIQKNLASLVLPPHVMRRSPRTSDGEILTFAFSICHLFYTYIFWSLKCINLWQNTVKITQNSIFRVLFGFFHLLEILYTQQDNNHDFYENLTCHRSCPPLHHPFHWRQTLAISKHLDLNHFW